MGWAVKLNQQGLGTKLFKASNLIALEDAPLAFSSAGAQAAGRAEKFAAAAAKVAGGVEVAQNEAIKMQRRLEASIDADRHFCHKYGISQREPPSDGVSLGSISNVWW